MQKVVPMKDVQQKQPLAVRKTETELISEVTCTQIKESLDDLFGGRTRLEETHPHIKHLLFEHLENCRKCCRAFDVRVRFRPSRRGGIY